MNGTVHLTLTLMQFYIIRMSEVDDEEWHRENEVNELLCPRLLPHISIHILQVFACWYLFTPTFIHLISLTISLQIFRIVNLRRDLLILYYGHGICSRKYKSKEKPKNHWLDNGRE